MSRDATTGIYTRVSNSFSDPVVGTVISPTDADTYFDDIDSGMNAFIGTSTSSLLIATGSKSFTTQTTKAFLVGSFVQAFSQASHANYMYGSVTSYNTGTGVLVLNVTAIGGAGTLSDWLLFTAGAQGATGATGSTGATGATSGIKQAYSSTTADADPGNGIFRLNNATPASATAAYLDNLDASGATVSGIFDLWDDSTNTVRGSVTFEKSTDPTVWARFQITGSVVDGTGYRKLTLANGSGSGAFTATDTFAITFARAGDKGADGAGTGDVSSNTATSVDSEIVLFNSTTGKSVKRASLTGLVKATSGVASAATAGTDYVKPDTTSALTAGFTSASVSAGTKSSGTYTFDPTAGAVQHATNGGAHTFAPPATMGSWMLDYVNNGSAGAITTSGWTKVDGDVFDTTNTHAFRCYLSVGNQGSHLNVKRMV